MLVFLILDIKATSYILLYNNYKLLFVLAPSPALLRRSASQRRGGEGRGEAVFNSPFEGG